MFPEYDEREKTAAPLRTRHSAPSTEPALGRLRWHSRRGMLELDLVLARFWEQFGAELSAEDEAALEILLEHEDNDLLKLIFVSETGASRVLQMLRAA